jgi:beta-phosphoglucomutase-like phosphatase (HAD superfamily)
LIDSVDYHAITWHEALEYYNIPAKLADVRMQIGKAGDQLLPVFATDEQIRKYGEEIKARKTRSFHDEYFHKIKPFPGVRELFESIKQRHIPIALASSAQADELDIYKKIANVSDLIDCQTSANSKDVRRSKPYPGKNIDRFVSLTLISTRKC